MKTLLIFLLIFSFSLQGFAGINENKTTTQVAQQVLLGTVTITGCAAPWQNTGTSVGDFGVQTGCVYTPSGNALAPATMLPAIKFASIPAGEIRIEYEGTANTIGTNLFSYFQVFDGTNYARETSTISSGTTNVWVPGMAQTFNYSAAQSNITFTFRAKVDATATARLYGTTGNPGVIRVYFTPSSTQATINPNQVVDTTGLIISVGSSSCPSNTIPANGAAYSQSAYPKLYAKLGTSFGDGTKNADGTVSGLTAGTAFNVPDERGRFERMTDGTAGNDPDSASRTAQNTGGATGNNVGSVQADQFASHTHNFYGPASSNVAGGSNVDFINQTVGKTVATTAAGGNETRPKNINVNKCIIYDGTIQAPLLVGTIVTPSTTSSETFGRLVFGGAGSLSSATSCSSSPCTIYDQNGSWVSSVTWSSTGTYVVNFAPGTFSSPPTCVANQYNGAVVDTCTVFSASTTTSINVLCRETNTPTDSGASVFCLGPH